MKRGIKYSRKRKKEKGEILYFIIVTLLDII
jgi:hypothetical protein